MRDFHSRDWSSILHGSITYGTLAQLVERGPFKPEVQGSSPWRPTFKQEKVMATPSWERIVEVYDPDGELRTTTDRLEVPGGWIYRELTQEGVALVFVPKFTDSKDDGLDI